MGQPQPGQQLGEGRIGRPGQHARRDGRRIVGVVHELPRIAVDQRQADQAVAVAPAPHTVVLWTSGNSGLRATRLPYWRSVRLWGALSRRGMPPGNVLRAIRGSGDRLQEGVLERCEHCGYRVELL